MSIRMVFPFTVYGDHHRMSDPGFKLWFKHRGAVAPGVGCYEVDVVVKSRTAVTFVVFGMRDFVYGGRGARQGGYDATVREAEDTADIVKREILDHAKYVWAEAETRRKQAEIAKIAAQITLDLRIEEKVERRRKKANVEPN